MAPIANALRLIYRVMSAKKQVGKSLEFANPLLKVLYVLIVDITLFSIQDSVLCKYGRTLPSY
jgi:hypothetical protein